MSSSRGEHFGLFLGPFWCVIFCFLRTIQYFFMKQLIDFLKLYGPFLWMRFNCLKATGSPQTDSLLFTTKSQEGSGLSITLMLLSDSYLRIPQMVLDPPLLGNIFMHFSTHAIFEHVFCCKKPYFLMINICTELQVSFQSYYANTILGHPLLGYFGVFYVHFRTFHMNFCALIFFFEK